MMTAFRFNIEKIQDNVYRFKKSSNSVSESMNIISSSLASSDSYWKDKNSEDFVLQVKKDYHNFDEYMISLNNRYNEIFNFSNSLISACSKYGFKNPKNVKFNDSRYVDCIKYLNQVIELLNIDLSKLNSIKTDLSGSYLTSAINKIAKVKKVITSVEDLKRDIVGFYNSVNECVENSMSRKGKIEKKELEISDIKYIWKVN